MNQLFFNEIKGLEAVLNINQVKKSFKMRHLEDSLKVIPEGFKNQTKSTKYTKMNANQFSLSKKAPPGSLLEGGKALDLRSGCLIAEHFLFQFPPLLRLE